MIKRALVVLKQTSYERFVLRRRDPLSLQLLEEGDRSVRSSLATHRSHTSTVETVKKVLAKLGVKTTIRDRREGRVPHGTDIVVTVGGDGTLLTTSHSLGAGIPIVGINSSPNTSVGFFCAGAKDEVPDILEQALLGKLPALHLARMRVERNGDCLSNRVLNDALFCHASPAATSRYELTLIGRGRKEAEEHRSSGIWVGPAAGSTAAQKSAGGRVLSLRSKALQYVVREPYVQDGHHLYMQRGLVPDHAELFILSKMRSARLFLDGPDRAFHLKLGDRIRLSRSEEPLTVLGMRKR
ncbi:MAG: NAD(+)/NADH kinase [Polyangiaceae bacterium]